MLPKLNSPTLDKTKLDSVGRAMLRHLKAHQPNRMRALVSQGLLEDHLLQGQEAAEQWTQAALKKGMDHQSVREVVRETWISLPDISRPKDPLTPQNLTTS